MLSHVYDMYELFEPFRSQDLISNSPYWLSNSFGDTSLDNLVLDQLNDPLVGSFSLFSSLVYLLLY